MNRSDADCRKSPIKGDIAIIDFMVMILEDEDKANNLALALSAEHPKNMVLLAFAVGMASGFGMSFAGRNHNDMLAEFLTDYPAMEFLLKQALTKRLYPGEEMKPPQVK